ncbi:MAG TPA: hypothetical protein VN039_12590, partial [Nitrospira sp.]|nr:hypothetical protein [Nitrospira sp.]
QDYGSRLYDEASATFSKGRIGRHMECFEERHFALFDALPQDFMEALGYSRSSLTSSRTKELRHRPLVVKSLSQDALYTPRLVREGVLGWNIVEIAGKYFPVRHGVRIISADDAKVVSEEQEGFWSLRDAMDALIHGAASTARPAAPEITGPVLTVEGYCGFNIVRYNGGWYGFNQSSGDIDIRSLSESALKVMKGNKHCVTGENVADVKAEILRLYMNR